MAKTKKQSKFKGKVSSDAKRQQTQASSYGYLNLPQGVNIFSADPGSRMKLDILPYVVTDDKHPDRNEEQDIAMKGDIWYKRPFKTHRNIGSNNETVVCPTSIGKKCPICEYRLKLIKEGRDKEEYAPLKASQRNLYAVVPINSKKFEEKPHVWDISQFLFQNLLNDELEENPDYEVFPDLEEGLTLRIRFDSKTIGTSQPFAEASRIDFEEREHEYEEDMLDDIPKLDEMLNIMSYKELEAKFMEYEDEEDAEPVVEDAPEDDTPVIRRKKKAKPEPEDDDDKKKNKPEPEEDEPEDDEDEKPVTRKKKKVEPEEDDEPAPKKTKSSKKGEDKCPHGHRYGVDTDTKDECDECDIWDDCIEEKEKNE